MLGDLTQLASGVMLAGYRIEALLTRGAVAVVYRATQLALARPVALKLLAPELADDPAFRERFLREARIAAQLEHPHLLPVYEAGEAEGVLFLALRYVEGDELSRVLERGPLEPHQAVRIVSQLASALQAAHARGLVHRDVKPANVLIAGAEGAEHAYLTDFGLAKPLSGRGLTRDGEFLAAVEYLAPEQIERAEADERSDLYALGCLFFACLTGRSPLAHEHNESTLWAHSQEESLRPRAVRRGLPAAFDEFMARALAKDPAQRYQQAEELGRAAQEALQRAASTEKRSATGARIPTNLPTPPTPLLGREHEFGALAELIRRKDVRLLTLTGPPGTGKTRLALALGLELLEEFPDGVFFIELATVADPALVAPTIAQTLGVKESLGQPVLDRLNEHLSDKCLLIILDNFEHVLEAAPWLSDLPAAAPALKLVATSRERLHLSFEHEFPLAPLAEEEAVEFFAARAHAVQPSFGLERKRAVVDEICRRLDGLPLALELAAARLKILSPESLLARLEQRLPLLTSGLRDAPERQRTLRATIEWSYELLASTEQELLVRLAVFTGGCTLEAAEDVCEADLDTLSSLLDKSLLQHTGERFKMLDTIREYALGQLEESGAADNIGKRHAEYYLALAERAQPALARRQEQVEWLGRLGVEHENLRAALTWALNRDPQETALRLGASLRRYFVLRSVAEGRQWLSEVIARGGTAPRAERAEVLAGAGQLAQAEGDYVEALGFYEESLALRRELGDEEGTARSLHDLGWLALHLGDYEPARLLLEESLSLRQRLGSEPALVGATLNILGIVALYQADVEGAESLFKDCLAIARERDDQLGRAAAVNNLSLVSIYRGDFEAAIPRAEEGLALFKELEFPEGEADSLDNLARVALGLGDYARARELLIESLTLSSYVDDKWGIAECLEGLAGVAAAQAADERATRLYAAAASLRKTIGAIKPPIDRAEYDRDTARSRDRLGDEAWAAVYEEGKAMTIEQAVEFALQETEEAFLSSP